uniref:Uncharacterized protein n=1 Tax=Triticum urartu TaxID=4572 RepID=A0A8R7Q3E7_TRIUA
FTEGEPPPPLPLPKLALFLSSPPPRAAGRQPADFFASGKHRLVFCSAAAVVELEPGCGGAFLSMPAARSGGGRGAGRGAPAGGARCGSPVTHSTLTADASPWPLLLHRQG